MKVVNFELVLAAMALALIVGCAAAFLLGRAQKRAARRRAADGRLRHPVFRGRKPRPRHRGRRLPERTVAGLTDCEWPDLLARLESGEVYDLAGEEIARQHDRNAAEMPELNPRNIDGGTQ